MYCRTLEIQEIKTPALQANVRNGCIVKMGVYHSLGIMLEHSISNYDFLNVQKTFSRKR